MGPFSLLLFFFFFLIPFSLASDSGQETQKESKLTTFLLLFFLFFVALILVLVLRLCRPVSMAIRSSTARAGRLQLVLAETSQPSPSGIGKEVINSLPVFQFPSFQEGSGADSECAVCLARFEDADLLRLLPKCSHAFHMNCVDKWLEGHKSCPVCRQSVEVQDVLSLDSYPGDRNMKQDTAASSLEHRITVS